MIRYIVRQNSNPKSETFGKYYAYPVIEETVDLDGLAAHMAEHNTPFSKGAIKGILTDMVTCIKHILLEGKNVKINDLAIFSLGIRNKKGGSDSEGEFNPSRNVDGVRLRARSTGVLNNANLNLDADLKKWDTTRGTTSGSSSSGSSSSSGPTTPIDEMP